MYLVNLCHSLKKYLISIDKWINYNYKIFNCSSKINEIIILLKLFFNNNTFILMIYDTKYVNIEIYKYLFKLWLYE